MHIFDTLKNLSHETLLHRFSQIVSREKEITAQVVAYLAEVRKRKLYAGEGYSSLFSFLTEKYRYSKGAAYRRIQAAKVALLFPEVLALLSSGKLQLISLCLIEPHLTLLNGKELISRVIGKSKEEIEYDLETLFPKVEKNRDKIRRLPIASPFPPEMGAQSELKERVIPRAEATRGEGSRDLSRDFSPSAKQSSGLGMTPCEPKESMTNTKETDRFHSGTDIEKLSQKSLAEPEPKSIRRVKIEFVADEEVAELIEKARALLSHKYPKGRLEDLVREAFQTLLEKKDLMKKKAIQPESPVQVKSESRYIPVQVKKEVWSRDEGRCTFVNIEERRCDERLYLHFDHIRPFSLDGKTTTSNLRLLCATHNLWRAEQMFNDQKSRGQG